MSNNRFTTIDFFKGILVLLVIAGHVIQGGIHTHVVRNFIYSFHMPLFVGISGALFNSSAVAQLQLSELIRKYALRLILPWIWAVLFFHFFSVYQFSEALSWRHLIKSFVFPYYHLWFITGFMAWVGCTWALKKMKLSDTTLLMVSALISLVAMLVQKFPELLFSSGHAPSLLKAIIRAYGPHFYFFFVLGMVLRKNKLDVLRPANYVVPFFCLIAVIVLFYYPNEALSLVNFFILNGFLLLLLLKVALQKPIPRFPWVESLGIHSLGLYLWHVLPIHVCHLFIIPEQFWAHYLLALALQVFFIFSYFYLVKSSVLKKYVFGVSS